METSEEHWQLHPLSRSASLPPLGQVVDLVRNSGASVIFHTLSEDLYKQAKEQGVDLPEPKTVPVANGVTKHSKRPKLCYLVKSNLGFGFSIRSVTGELFLKQTNEKVLSGRPLMGKCLCFALLRNATLGSSADQ